MKYLVVIPARGGSKGIPLKNIANLCGKPLINYTLDTLQSINIDCDIVVSTDSSIIKEKINHYKYITIIDRPSNISGDIATTESALLHALNTMEKGNCKYDAVITLQVTSPFRKLDTIVNCVNRFELNFPQYDALLTLNETYQDFWTETNYHFSRLYPNNPRRRQDRKPIYVENGLVYITSTESLKSTKSVLGNKCDGFITDSNESLDINEQIDLLIAECIMKERFYVNA